MQQVHSKLLDHFLWKQLPAVGENSALVNQNAEDVGKKAKSDHYICWLDLFDIATLFFVYILHFVIIKYPW